MSRTFVTPFKRTIVVGSQDGGINLRVTAEDDNVTIPSFIPRDVLLDLIGASIVATKITPGELFGLGYIVPAPVEAKKTTVVTPRVTPQALEILRHLESVGSISNVEAQALYKCRALPRRIADLKANGYEIISTIRVDHTGQRYARYELRASKKKAA